MIHISVFSVLVTYIFRDALPWLNHQWATFSPVDHTWRHVLENDTSNRRGYAKATDVSDLQRLEIPYYEYTWT